jgi:hypothetical protein
MADVLPNVEGDAGEIIQARPAALVSPDGTVYEAGAQMAQKKCVRVDVTLSLDTGIYAANEVLADTQVISNVFRANDVGGELESVTVIDIDYQTAANDAMTLCVGNLRRLLKPVTGTRNLAVAVTTGGAPTHTSQASCSGVVGGVVRPVYFV